MVWKLAVGLFRGLALFSARPWLEGIRATGLWWWNCAVMRALCISIAIVVLLINMFLMIDVVKFLSQYLVSITDARSLLKLLQ